MARRRKVTFRMRDGRVSFWKTKTYRPKVKVTFYAKPKLSEDLKIHKLVYKRFGKDKKKTVPFYLCSQAFYAKESKCSRLWKRVTCLNCLKQNKRERAG